MAYQALYRKWRPSTFAEVIGQEPITRTLCHEIQSGRVAHAYLFCGSRGTGKTSTAKVFSKAVNCLAPVEGNPCNQCAVCRGIADGSLMDVVEIDAASNNGVDNIRTINNDVSYLPSGMKYKIYIIDEVHMLSNSAFNALLKTLEEPPAHVIFILATTELHKVPATILSRCQRFDFRRIGVDTMVHHLEKVAERDGLAVEDRQVLELIAAAADGSVRDALSLLDQASCYDGGVITASVVRSVTGGVSFTGLEPLVDALVQGDLTSLLSGARELLIQGVDPIQILDGLLQYMRNLTLCLTTQHPENLLDVTQDRLAVLKTQAAAFTPEECLEISDTLLTAYDTAKWAGLSKVVLDMTLLRIGLPKCGERPVLQVELPRTKESPKPEPIPVAEPEEEIPPVEEEPPALEEKEEESPVLEEPEEPSVSDGDIIGQRDEIITAVSRNGNGMLAAALRMSEFRYHAGELRILDMMPMANTAEHATEIQRAVRDICGVDIAVALWEKDREVVRAGMPKAASQDPLEALSEQLAGKVQIEE